MNTKWLTEKVDGFFNTIYPTLMALSNEKVKMKTITSSPLGDWNGGAIVVLPGRGGSGQGMIDRHKLHDTKMIAYQPDIEWYPMPRGPGDQTEAVAGASESAIALLDKIKAYADLHKIDTRKIALVGPSAGAVMALTLAVTSDVPFAAVVSCNGCILDPSIIPECRHPDVPIWLYHNKDDKCFSWNERYLPTKDALLAKKYPIVCKEQEMGGHDVSSHDLKDVTHFLSKSLSR